MIEIQVDRVQLIAAAMHMHVRVRPWNNVLAIVPRQLRIYAMTFTCIRPAHTRRLRVHIRMEHYISALSNMHSENLHLELLSETSTQYNYIAERVFRIH